MNGVTPEQIVAVTDGATPVQIVILIVLGVIALGVVIGIVRWVIDLKLGTLPHDISTIRESLLNLKTEIAKIEGKLWSKDDIQREIKAAIIEHVEKCPFHHTYKEN